MNPPTAGSSPAIEVPAPFLLVTHKIADASLRPPSGQIALFAERRLFLKRRWRGKAEDGTEFGFDLESRLNDGCVVLQTEVADYVVRQEHEPVYVLFPRSMREAALLGWHLGNLHQPVEIRDGAYHAAHDPAVRQLLERERWPYEERTLLFNPLRVTPHAP